MKRFMAFLLAMICLWCGSAVSEYAATPTDLEEELVEIDDEDWGEIEIEFERKVYISMETEPHYIGDEMRLVATLIDFQPEDKYRIYWQFSLDGLTWTNIEGEHQQTITIVIDNKNYKYWWRVLVEMEE